MNQANFWSLSDGSAVTTDGTAQQSEDIKPIPDDTQCQALIDEVKWDENQEGARYISARWSILGGEYNDRKVFQKLWVLGGKPNDKNPQTTTDKAKRMLAAIDMNAGGKLMQLGKMPTDQDLMTTIANRPQMIHIKTWKMDGKEGNWINAVAPRSKQQAPQQAQAPQQQTTQGGGTFDEDIGF